MSEQPTFQSATLPARFVPAGTTIMFGLLLMMSTEEAWINPGQVMGLRYRSGEIVRWLGLASTVAAALYAADLLPRMWFARAVSISGLTALAAIAWVLVFIAGDSYGTTTYRTPGSFTAAGSLWMALVCSAGITLSAALAPRLRAPTVHALSALVSACAAIVIGTTVMPWTLFPFEGDRMGIEYTAGAIALVFAIIALMSGVLRLSGEITDGWFGRSAFPASLAVTAATSWVYATDPGRVHYPSGLLLLLNPFSAPRVEAQPALHVAVAVSFLMLACSALATWAPSPDLLRRFLRMMRYSVPGTLPPP